MRVQEITIDLYDPYPFETQYVQYDDSQLIITALNNGLPYLFDRVFLNYTLPSGSDLTQKNDITYDGNVITVNIDKLILRNNGNLNVDVVFYYNGKRISTYIFYMVIAPSPGNGELPDSDDVFIKLINISNWILQSDNKYTITLTEDVHNLSTTAYVDTLERLNNGLYEDITYMYNRTLDGTITIITDVPYIGRLVLRR